ncbi:MAG: hypothetical protein D6768_15275 [Chloroflexi bacterium]|nr:MAG: hypothetical protein D6768_15275 [Chloroflexota bacterium]
MTEVKWQMLLKSAFETEEVEIGCEDCHEALDMYAELLLEKADPAAAMPAVEQHLKQCQCCAGELEALLIMINEAVLGNEASPTVGG